MEHGPMRRMLYLHKGENEPTLQGTPDHTKPPSEGGGETEEKTVADIMEDIAENLGVAFHCVLPAEIERVRTNFENLGDKIFLAHSGQTPEDGIWVSIDGDDGRKLMYTMIRDEADLRTVTSESGFFEPLGKWLPDGR